MRWLVRLNGPSIAAWVSTAVACSLVLLSTRRGVGLNPDSTLYISSGMNLEAGRGLVGFDGRPLTMFAPALPVAIALSAAAGLGPEVSVRVINVVSAATVIVLGALLLRRHVRSTALVVASVLTLGVATQLVALSRMALTDVAFAAISLGFVLSLERLGRPKASWWRTMAPAVAMVWLGFAMRYAGLSFLPIGAATIVVGSTTGLRCRLVRAAAFVVVGAAFPVVWMARNLAADGTVMASRSTASNGVDLVLGRFVAVGGSWIDASAGTYTRAAVVGVAGIAVFGLFLVLLHRRPTTPRLADLRRLGLVPLVVFVVGYSLYIFAVEVAVAIDQLDGRLLAPVFVPAMVLACVATEPHRSCPRVGPAGSGPERRSSSLSCGV